MPDLLGVIDGPIAYGTFNRPDARNALSDVMRVELFEFLDSPFPKILVVAEQCGSRYRSQLEYFSLSTSWLFSQSTSILRWTNGCGWEYL